jgi:hypothetical protein
LVGRSLSHPAAISRFSFEETRARVGRFRDDEGWYGTKREGCPN